MALSNRYYGLVRPDLHLTECRFDINSIEKVLRKIL